MKTLSELLHCVLFLRCLWFLQPSAADFWQKNLSWCSKFKECSSTCKSTVHSKIVVPMTCFAFLSFVNNTLTFICLWWLPPPSIALGTLIPTLTSQPLKYNANFIRLFWQDAWNRLAKKITRMWDITPQPIWNAVFGGM